MTIQCTHKLNSTSEREMGKPKVHQRFLSKTYSSSVWYWLVINLIFERRSTVWVIIIFQKKKFMSLLCFCFYAFDDGWRGLISTFVCVRFIVYHVEEQFLLSFFASFYIAYNDNQCVLTIVQCIMYTISIHCILSTFQCTQCVLHIHKRILLGEY